MTSCLETYLTSSSQRSCLAQLSGSVGGWRVSPADKYEGRAAAFTTVKAVPGAGPRGQWLPKQDGWGQECAGKHLSHRLRSFCLPYWLLTGVAVGLTVADIELTQHCLHQGTCHEGNPLVPTTNQAKLYPLQFGLTVVQSYLAYRLKKKGSKAWWLPQFSLSASHAVGVGFGLRFVWGE